MSALAAPSSHSPAASAGAPAINRLKFNRLGLWLFFLSEMFLFGGLMVARFYLLGGNRPDVEQILGLIVTTVLLLSSFFMARGETAMAHGDRKTFSTSLLITALLGALFLAGVVFVEWPSAPFRPWTDVTGAVFYGLTGMHALHVFTGLIFIGIVWNNGRKGHYSPENHWGVEACAIYWHYVDLVWIFFYPALYLIGRPVG